MLEISFSVWRNSIAKRVNYRKWNLLNRKAVCSKEWKEIKSMITKCWLRIFKINNLSFRTSLVRILRIRVGLQDINSRWKIKSKRKGQKHLNPDNRVVNLHHLNTFMVQKTWFKALKITKDQNLIRLQNIEDLKRETKRGICSTIIPSQHSSMRKDSKGSNL